MNRKIVQISAISPGRSVTKGYQPGVLALADDGSVWGAGFNPNTLSFDPWEKLPDLPGTDQEAAEILARHRAAKVEKPQLSFWQFVRQQFLTR
ncbi:hypothetical protein [Pseudomonas aeruginosa]|uniref:hypothetical protein n=1 Tax=Pseudomonas aeruginosa TaxID=287 RepID=UPI0013CE289D|nr:hypothetical protein [Pseudomonas aeruginosa]